MKRYNSPEIFVDTVQVKDVLTVSETEALKGDNVFIDDELGG